MGNSTIESVSLGSANVIYDFSFDENTIIKSVVIEYNAEKELYIQTAFAGCTSLTEIVLPKNLHYVAVGGFSGFESLNSVFFGGTSDEWASVEVENELNDEFLSASLYFYSETEPTDTEGLYWHYVDGVATPW